MLHRGREPLRRVKALARGLLPEPGPHHVPLPRPRLRPQGSIRGRAGQSATGLLHLTRRNTSVWCPHENPQNRPSHRGWRGADSAHPVHANDAVCDLPRPSREAGRHQLRRGLRWLRPVDRRLPTENLDLHRHRRSTCQKGLRDTRSVQSLTSHPSPGRVRGRKPLDAGSHHHRLSKTRQGPAQLRRTRRLTAAMARSARKGWPHDAGEGGSRRWDAAPGLPAPLRRVRGRSSAVRCAATCHGRVSHWRHLCVRPAGRPGRARSGTADRVGSISTRRLPERRHLHPEPRPQSPRRRQPGRRQREPPTRSSSPLARSS